MTMEEDVSVNMSEELNDIIEGQLEYGDSKAGWIREAIREKLERESQGSESKQKRIEAHSD